VGRVRVVDQDRLRIWGARLAAPAAFLAAALVLVFLVQNAIDTTSSQATGTPTETVPTATGPGPTTGTSEKPRKRVYRVQSGDTLESIAARFSTTVGELTRLNPGIDPLTLTPGQRIRVSGRRP
jgi:LysM repeat protein